MLGDEEPVILGDGRTQITFVRGPDEDYGFPVSGTFTAGAFSGDYTEYFYGAAKLEDIKNFERTLSGSVEIASVDRDLSVTLFALSRGHIRVAVCIRRRNPTAELKFEFETDQSYLPPFVRFFKKICEQK